MEEIIWGTGVNLEQPEQGDSGNVFCPGLNSNITKIARHKHTGADSLALDINDIAKDTSLEVTSWDVSGSKYKKDLLFPDGFTWGSTTIEVIGKSSSPIAADQRLYLEVEKNGTTGFTVYTSNNTLDVDILLS